MGADPWHYFVPYRTDINSALQDLREREFRAGRYGNMGLTSEELELLGDLAEEFSDSKASVDELIEEYGDVQSAMEAVFAEYEPDGTASILDMFRVSDTPEICAVAPLSSDALRELFSTDQPSHELLESILLNEQEPDKWGQFWDSIGRGEG